MTLLPDLDLLRLGLVEPDDLHPLVHKALFPARTVGNRPIGPPEVGPPPPVRIRCGDTEHPLGMRGGRLAPVADGAEPVCRDHVLGALGGAPSPCDSLVDRWNMANQRYVRRAPGPSAKLPAQLFSQRYELFELALHGDTRAVVRWLDAGFDPHVRHGQLRRNLMAYLPWLDHEEVLPRLVAAGVAIDHDAIQEAERFGSAGLIRGLLEAVPKEYQWLWMSLPWFCAQEVWRSRRRDLQFVWDYVR